MTSARSDVSDLGADVAADLTLQRGVEVIRVRRLEVLAPTDDREAWRKVRGACGRSGQWIGQRQRRRRVDLEQGREWRREHAVLEEVSLSRQRVVEQSQRRANR